MNSQLQALDERIKRKEEEMTATEEGTNERVDAARLPVQETVRLEAPQPAQIPEPAPPPDEGDLPEPARIPEQYPPPDEGTPPEPARIPEQTPR